MAWPFPALLGLLLLFIGQAKAGPETDLRPVGVQSSTCQEHKALHNRLDTVEKRVENTLQKLETEMTFLLDAIENPEWQPILDPDGPTIDILDDQDKSVAS
ncbi:placenta-specific protein 9 [Arapaima gigas]